MIARLVQDAFLSSLSRPVAAQHGLQKFLFVPFSDGCQSRKTAHVENGPCSHCQCRKKIVRIFRGGRCSPARSCEHGALIRAFTVSWQPSHARASHEIVLRSLRASQVVSEHSPHALSAVRQGRRAIASSTILSHFISQSKASRNEIRAMEKVCVYIKSTLRF